MRRTLGSGTSSVFVCEEERRQSSKKEEELKNEQKWLFFLAEALFWKLAPIVLLYSTIVATGPPGKRKLFRK
jgi:uncharacterized membrane-anchored protein